MPELADLVDPTHTVLVLQECQKGVIGERSNLPDLAAQAREQLIPNAVRLTGAARAAGVKVVHCTAAHHAGYWGANRNARVFAGVRRSPVKLVVGDEATEPLDEIGVDPADVVVPRAHGLSPFQGTELDSLLRNEGIRTIVAVGVSVNVAITNLTFDAVNAAYQVVIPTDAVVGFPADYAEAVLANTLALCATLTTTEDLVACWTAATA